MDTAPLPSLSERVRVVAAVRDHPFRLLPRSTFAVGEREPPSKALPPHSAPEGYQPREGVRRQFESLVSRQMEYCLWKPDGYW